MPLFVEEVTRLLLERGEQGGTQAIPPTLQQSLMARLDRLGPAREVAQIGSVIGRGFSYKLLKAIAGMDDSPLEAALEKLSDADIVLVDGVLPDSDYRFKHALIQDAAYENLLKTRRQVLHRHIAETLRDSFADKAAAEPELLAHHFTQAGLTDSAIEWWGKAGDQALRRSAFQEAIAHLGKAIEMADKESDFAQRPAAAPSQRLKLQTTYGQALSWAKGYAAPETAAAFARARDLAAINNNNPAEQFASIYGQWSVDILRAELASARQLADILLADAEKAMRRPEMAVGRRITALTCFVQGAFEEAQINAEEALKIYDPEWDSEIKFRTNHDTGATATAYMALTSWMFGNIRQAQKFADEATSRALLANHVPTVATTRFFIVLLDAISGRAERTRTDAAALIQITREHATPLFLSLATIFQGWAVTRLGDRAAGRANLAEGLANYTGQGNRTFLPLIWGMLAHIEAEDGGTQAALIRIDEALALEPKPVNAGAILSCTDPRRDSTQGRPSENGAGGRCFPQCHCHRPAAEGKELRAAGGPRIGKVYQSNGQLADAHAVLAPALEGFSPAVEFPDIAEAQALLVATAEADEVKRTAASRHRRLKLQTNFGRAMMWSKGYAAQETKVAFARARELCADITDPAERFPTYYGLWVGSLMRGELASARETANIFLGDAESGAWLSEAAAARRALGQTCLWQGDFNEAQTHFEKALKIYDFERDREVKFRFGMDTMAGSKALLAVAKWLFGDTGRARELIESALALAAEFDHVGTLAPITYHRAELEIYAW